MTTRTWPATPNRHGTPDAKLPDNMQGLEDYVARLYAQRGVADVIHVTPKGKRRAPDLPETLR